MINVLLLCGGGGSEHDISVISSKHIENSLSTNKEVNLLWIEIGKDHLKRDNKGRLCEITESKNILFQDGEKFKIDYVIPCLHGFPGETGDIQSMLEFLKIPYLGCNSETSKNCFNKITTKLWLSALDIPNTPYVILNDVKDTNKAIDAFNLWGSIFIKASSQGSSVGCYKVTTLDDVKKYVIEAFKFSPYVLVEKCLSPRELEVSAYQHNSEIKITYPGEIITPKNSHYSFEEKYSNQSQTTTLIKAQNLSDDIAKKIKDYALKAFLGLKLRHLSRIDFFYVPEADEIFLNEINTFPGMTPISMFPKMMEANGDLFSDFLIQTIKSDLS